jgi:hypothetical protein
MHDVGKSAQRLAVGKEIVYYQHAVVLGDELFVNSYVEHGSLGKRADERGIGITRNVLGLRFLGKHNVNAEITRRKARDSDARSLYGKYYRGVRVLENIIEFLTDLVDKLNIHTVIEKSRYDNDAARLDLALGHYFLFKKLHFAPLKLLWTYYTRKLPKGK